MSSGESTCRNNDGAADCGVSSIKKSYEKRDDGTWIEDSGFVIRLLSDDNDGSRHQRFILQLANRDTLLIAHNIDLAKRVPLGMGDRVKFRGMYEWNNLGGLVHWTHHDPHGIEDGGAVSIRGTRYSANRSTTFAESH